MKQRLWKLLSLLLAILLAGQLLPATAMADSMGTETSDYSGTCGQNLRWYLNTATNTLSIHGTGAMDDYDAANSAPWSQWYYEIDTLVLNPGVTHIGTYAFHNCSYLCGDLVIPEGVTSIGNFAFYYSYEGAVEWASLCAWETIFGNKLVLPKTLESIGNRAFGYCDQFDSVVFLGDVPTISSDAFYQVTANGYYPAENETWMDTARQNYGGTLTWQGFTQSLWDFDRDSYCFLNSYSDFCNGDTYYVRQEHLDAYLANLSETDLYNMAIHFARRDLLTDWMPEAWERNVLVRRFMQGDLCEWGGSCYGFAITAGLFRTGALNPELFLVSSTREIPAPDPNTDSHVESFINLFHLTQWTDAMMYRKHVYSIQDARFPGYMSTLFSNAKSMEDPSQIFILLMFGEAGHAVVCYGAESGEWAVDGKTYSQRLLLADSNCNTKPSYLYATEDCTEVVYVYYKNGAYRKTDWKQLAFGSYEVYLNEALIEQLGIPDLFKGDGMHTMSDVPVQLSLEQEEPQPFMLWFDGEHTCTITSEQGSATLENGVLTENTLDAMVSGYLSEAGTAVNPSCHVLLPGGVTYTVTAKAGTTLSMSVDYGDMIYGAYAVEAATFGEEQILTVQGNEEGMRIDVVRNESALDFLSVTGEASGTVCVSADGDQVALDGSWSACEVSHLDRSDREVSVALDSSEGLLVELDSQSHLRTFSDTDGDGTCETPVLVDGGTAALLSLDENAAVLQLFQAQFSRIAVAVYDRNGKMLSIGMQTVETEAAAEVTVPLSVFDVSQASAVKVFFLKDEPAATPLCEAAACKLK